MTLGNNVQPNYLEEKRYNPIALDVYQQAELEVALTKFRSGYETLVSEYPVVHNTLRHFQNVFSYFTTLGNMYPRFISEEDKKEDLAILIECRESLNKFLKRQPHTSNELDTLEEYYQLSGNKDFKDAIQNFHTVTEYNEPIQVVIDALQTFHNHIERFW